MKTWFKGLLLALALVSAPAFAANVDGDWSGPIDSPNGPVQMNYTFKADGANISFAVDVDFGGTAMTLKYTGFVAADGVALTMDFQGQPVNITVKKVAAK